MRHEQAREKIFQVCAINAPELLHTHDALNESVLPDPGMPNARAFLFSRRADPEIAPRGVKIPRDEAELVRTWIEIHVEVLPRRQDAIIVRKQNFPVEEPRDLV